MTLLAQLLEEVIDARASKADWSPTKAQAIAGNYKHGKIEVGGLKILIENPAGSVRRGTDRNGESWSVTMKHHYGYFPGTCGKDGDPIDVFVRKGLDDSWSGKVFVINQKDQDGKFDEVKVVLGATTHEEARQLYQANYSPGWDGVMSIGCSSFQDFVKWLRGGSTRKPFTGTTLIESILARA